MVVSYAAFGSMFAFVFCFGNAIAKEHAVNYNDSPVWTVGIGVMYADVNITLGEALAFVSYSGHDVVLVHVPGSGEHWDQCQDNGIQAGRFTRIFAPSDFGTSPRKLHYTPPTCGEFYIACSVSAHCMFGQRVKVVVNNGDKTPCTSPCVNAACVTESSKSSTTSALEIALKPQANSNWWGTGPFSRLEVDVGDSVVFRTGAGFHDVAIVPSRSSFDNCDMGGKMLVADWSYGTTDPSAACRTSPECCAGSSCADSGKYVTYRFNASVPGDVYFICSLGNGAHCNAGQKLIVTVRDSVTSSARTQLNWSLFVAFLTSLWLNLFA